MTIYDLDPMFSVCIDADGNMSIDTIRWSSVRKLQYLPEPFRIRIWIADEENKTREYLLCDADTERLIHAVYDQDRHYNRQHNPANVPLEFALCLKTGQIFTFVAKTA